MRVTIDLDDKRWWKVMWTIFKGCLITKKFPDEVRKSATGKGYHIIWRDLDIDEIRMFRYRKIIGDDKNRIKLDLVSRKRVSQVLFTKKKVVYFPPVETSLNPNK